MDSEDPKMLAPVLMFGVGVLLVNLRGPILGTTSLSIRLLHIPVIDLVAH